MLFVASALISSTFEFNDPGRMRGFLTTNVGSFLVATAVMLQALGIAWSAFLSRGRI